MLFLLSSYLLLSKTVYFYMLNKKGSFRTADRNTHKNTGNTYLIFFVSLNKHIYNYCRALDLFIIPKIRKKYKQIKKYQQIGNFFFCILNYGKLNKSKIFRYKIKMIDFDLVANSKEKIFQTILKLFNRRN